MTQQASGAGCNESRGLKREGSFGRGLMKAKNAKPGRPRKKPGDLKFGEFMRAGIVMSAYDEALKNGQKHSAAVRYAVEFVK
jgi:hypothetical protein